MSLLSSGDLEGFCELLDCFGVELTYAEAVFRAVLTEEESKARAFDMTPGDDQAVRIAAFADAFAARPRIGGIEGVG